MICLVNLLHLWLRLFILQDEGLDTSSSMAKIMISIGSNVTANCSLEWGETEKKKDSMNLIHLGESDHLVLFQNYPAPITKNGKISRPAKYQAS